MNLDNAVVFDIETFPNVFTLHAELLHCPTQSTWEISHYRDDRRELMTWFDWLARTQTPMIGFNNVGFDYPVIHFIWKNPQATVEEIYAYAMQIINGKDRFAHTIWANDRFTPQIDLYKIHHFDNKAKTTSLKALQINMRLPNVVDMPVEVGTVLHPHQVNNLLIPYNRWDVSSTKTFAHHSMTAMQFRLSLVEQFGPDVMNWNDSKIGSKILEQRLGDELCYDRSSGRRVMRQTPRHQIVLNNIIFPYVHFNHPEFQRIEQYIRSKVLLPDEFADTTRSTKIVTKGAFANLNATINGVVYKFGTGGLHGSVERQRIVATDEWLIRDIDVAALYPSIAIQNGLAPTHLGQRFVEEYARLPQDRKKFQKEFGKKSVQANSMKLASNGTYGNSNSEHSVFYDPQFTMTITINGQLMLAMLVEWLLTVPTVNIIAVNTDGITYTIHKNYLEVAKAKEKEWEALTKLTLEDQFYTRIFIRDVNSYIAEYEE